MAVATSGGPGQAVGAAFRLVICIATLSFRNLANLLTLFRLASALPLAWLLLEGERETAFWLFLVAAFTDIADGFVAKWLQRPTSFGAVLDPLADKLFLGILYLTLWDLGAIAGWLAWLVVARDLLIGAGAVLLRVRVRRLRIEPLVVGKLCTLVQLVYAGVVLGRLAGYGSFPNVERLIFYLVPVLVIASAGAYLGSAIRYGLSAPAGQNAGQ